MKKHLLNLSLLFAICGCADDRLHLTSPKQQIVNWHRIITDDDRERLRRWRDDMIAALAVAHASDPKTIDDAGALLKPDVALEQVNLGPGSYACRVIKLGAQNAGEPVLKSSPPVGCTVAKEGRLLRFKLKSGSERPEAVLYPDNARRMILLGTTILGDEAAPQLYGHDTTRDMVGIVERLSAAHWRILLPAPHFESLYDVIDITPHEGHPH